METTTPTKKTRALPRVWKQFRHVESEDLFDIKDRTAVKTSPITARFIEDRYLSNGRFFFVWPWRRVRTAQLVRDAKPGGKSSTAPFVPIRAAVLAPAVEVAPSQPNNDNTVTGPTS